ncbi:acyl carrier protein [Streptomyces alfalfae]|uniref:Acyl carrier protein n=1 Tax=Streptomyces alfalfae TaxID=1642299 RepID=A0A1P8TG49_9ACTN|nr:MULTISPECIES: phosphopantetheine-binding protein [Streptomyces]AYA16965.1 acyl carrier protein [Streptomyces fradiae]APY86579.1 acyl carrier protein [Streptomyces alfalfae]KUL50145.1 acyl carrier protein [Streptomyces sp. NRRL S-1521]QQC91162.1 acyl carrier protein [Streptomyces alfalfae]QUI33653.1 acyl carrier protein [Streptomyces alfalfae]
MLEQLKEILSNKLKVSPEAITPEATKDDIELDSLAVVELSLLLKSELDIDVSDDDLLEADTVADMVELMETRSAKV